MKIELKCKCGYTRIIETDIKSVLNKYNKCPKCGEKYEN